MDFDSAPTDATEGGWRPMWQLGWTLHGIALFPLLLLVWEMTRPPGNFAFLVVLWAVVVLGVPLLPPRPAPEPFSSW